MQMETFELALDWAVRLGGPELSFTGMGEALLNPRLGAMLRLARRRLPDTAFVLATNGIEIVHPKIWDGSDLLAVLRSNNVGVYVSTHRPEIAAHALELLVQNGVRCGVNSGFVTSGFDWAGQVDYHGIRAASTECQYLAKGWATILQNGDVVNCCMDAHGLHVIGNVHDLKMPERIEPIPLCANCHLNH